ncbi:serine/threonine protein phosphatase [Porphyrobacter algicida]|uniref:Serine/threonine protein phosphatase n=1 Tax=Qipengyuania algicida TaxID=1836209 RepID=A0A845AKN2_9SPHN|nr:metallophosphoesterase [Qipengyuania algicida]MXP27608.1 serine/threonine protein phosphatase [Qipengyuania algicida]
MLQSLRQFLRAERPSTRKPSVPEGERIYAVGDIHGRLDLFEALRDAIDADDAAAPDAKTSIILLGDLVDRGPDSAGVIEAVRAWQKDRPVRCILGNHEEMFLKSFSEVDVLRHFLRHGGRETITSFGLDRAQYNMLTLEDLQEEMQRLVPGDVRDYLADLEDLIVVGDYAFVHAGVNPEQPLDEQHTSDLRWIRDRFLRHGDPLSHVIVHGHTISEEVTFAGFRVGIDTGAYRTGRLTALVLEGTERRIIQAVDEDGVISIAESRGK